MMFVNPFLKRVLHPSLASTGYFWDCTNRTQCWLASKVRAVLSHWTAARWGRLRESGLRDFVRWRWKRFSSLLFSRDEVFFYQWPASHVPKTPDRFQVVPLDLETLAKAAIEGEEETYEYLSRSAQRLRAGSDHGFALLDAGGKPVHFCWVGDFEGFYTDELNVILDAPTSNAAIIFECWTPGPVRARGYYATAGARTAQRLVREGSPLDLQRHAQPLLRERARIVRLPEARHSLVRQKTLMRQRLTKLSASISPMVEVPVGS